MVSVGCGTFSGGVLMAHVASCSGGAVSNHRGSVLFQSPESPPHNQGFPQLESAGLGVGGNDDNDAADADDMMMIVAGQP